MSRHVTSPHHLAPPRLVPCSSDGSLPSHSGPAPVDGGSTGGREDGSRGAAASEATVAAAKPPKGVREIVKDSRPLAEVLNRDVWDAPRDGEAMPSKEEFALRRDMVERRAISNRVIVTFTNYAFLDFTVNWARHLTNLGLTNILIGQGREGRWEGGRGKVGLGAILYDWQPAIQSSETFHTC